MYNLSRWVTGFNSFHPSLRFTHKLKRSGKPNFSDLLIYRKYNKFLATVFRKPLGRLFPYIQSGYSTI